MFPALKESRPINTTVVCSIVPDIVNLGQSLINDSPVKDLDKMFISKENSDNTRSTSNANELPKDNGQGPTNANNTDPVLNDIAGVVKVVASLTLGYDKLVTEYKR